MRFLFLILGGGLLYLISIQAASDLIHSAFHSHSWPSSTVLFTLSFRKFIRAHANVQAFNEFLFNSPEVDCYDQAGW